MRDLALHFSKDLSAYFYKGWQASLIGPYALSFARSLIFYLNQFRIYLHINGIQHHHIREDKIKRLQQTTEGLHSLLPRHLQFSFSILLAVDDPRPSFFEESLLSALSQTAPQLEVLVGLMHPPSEKIRRVLLKAQEAKGERLKIFELFGLGKRQEVINALADEAKGQYFLILGEEDWIRPDALFRYEQTLRIFSEPERKVLYCNSNRMNDKGYFVPESEYRQPATLTFPYFFKPFEEKGVLVPASLWRAVNGLTLKSEGAEYERLFLQFDLHGASFQQLPLILYSVRASSQKTEKKSMEVFLQVLEEYSQAKGLDWKWVPGLRNDTVRAIPRASSSSIQVIIPYKDQRELTMKCINTLFKQKGVQFHVTAVDNGSHDLSIGEEIEKLGGEVLRIEEPFNYSRLNNLAVKMTKEAAGCDLLLFLNNDVELEPDALNEMLRWVDQPSIGMVGCRLHYPDGRLQHGGVVINPHGREEMRWEHVEKLRRLDELHIAKELGFCDAVTAACAMVKRTVFLDVGGFDEVWHPIGYSDTHLAVKLASKGLRSFYTPYAAGIHHESVSRKSAIEDYENSWWLHRLLLEQETASRPGNCGAC